MLKVYPSPFNKFAVFILYGLLSVTVITLAQQTEQPGQSTAASLPSGCPLTPFPSQIPNGKIIGYVQLDNINADTIQWKYYDYINVIAYPKVPNTPWNDFRPPNDLSLLKEFVTKADGTNTKVLLSIRNYDLSKFPREPKNIAKQTLEAIRETNVDGLDIEYPGMRGLYCEGSDGPYWNSVENDGDFVEFIKGIHDQLRDSNKTLMLTVGRDPVIGLNNNHIDFLNIETYHNSFYENSKNPLADSSFTRTYPNAPYTVYTSAYNTWIASGINNTKITMGVDLGNTFQIIDNQDIRTNQVLVTGKYPKEMPLWEQRINFCPGNNDSVILRILPWNQLADSVDTSNSSGNCYNFKEWERHFDNFSTFTPWLIKNSDQQNDAQQPQTLDYLSYEDFVSLSKKLSFAMVSSIGGISISDISYDDENISLVNYIQSIRQSKPASNSTNKGNGTSNGDNGTVGPSTPTNSDSPGPGRKEPPPPGVIAGAVIGSIVGLGLLSAILFLGYRYKDRFPFAQNKYNKETMYNYPVTHMNQPGMIPEGSPRMIIPDTTAIPIAPSYVTAMFDFAGKEENDLSFKKGDKIEVLERGDGPNDWWVGKVNGAVGEFPGNYVKE